MNNKLLISIFIGLLLVSSANAATYYISSSTGNDANNGLTTTTALKNSPGMLAYTGSAVLRPGDVVYFKNTDVWSISSGLYFLDVSGGVTYDGSSWGTGTRATLKAVGNLSTGSTGGATGRPIIRFANDDPSFPTIVRGFNVDANNFVATGISINWPSASKNLNGASKIIENCIIHDVFSKSPDTYSYSLIVGSMGGYSTQNVELLNNTIYNTSSNGIIIYPSLDFRNNTPSVINKVRNVRIIGNEIFSAGRDIISGHSCLGFKNDISNVLMEYNNLHDCDIGMNIAVSSYPYIPSTQNATIRYNLIHNNYQIGFWAGNTNISMSFKFYGNLVYENTYYGLKLSGSYKNLDAKIYNNIFYNNKLGPYEGSVILESVSGLGNTIDFSNNIIYVRQGVTPLYDSLGNKITTHKNNIYYRPDGGILVRNGATSYTSSNIASWESGVISANPLFKNVNAIPKGFIVSGENIVPDTDGLSFQSTSPGVDKGIALVTEYAKAIDGKSRPQGSAWDIGTYEYIVDGVTHPVDLNSDGCISLGEISSYVGRWLNNQVTMSQASSAVSKWLGGCQNE